MFNYLVGDVTNTTTTWLLAASYYSIATYFLSHSITLTLNAPTRRNKNNLKFHVCNVAGLPLLPLFIFKWQVAINLIQVDLSTFLIFSTFSNLFLVPPYLILIRRLEQLIKTKYQSEAPSAGRYMGAPKTALILIILGLGIVSDLSQLVL